MTREEKLAALKKDLAAMDGVAVAFSAGVDSTFLLKVAHDVLGDRAVAVTARSCSYPERELREAEQLLLDLGFRQVRVRIHGTLARIEVAPEERARLLEVNRDGSFSARLRELGFSYVTMDLDGYQTGSMNRTLGQGEDL